MLNLTHSISNNSQVGVLGLGVTGLSVVRYLQNKGIQPLVFDTRSKFDLPGDLHNLQVVWNATTLTDYQLDLLVVSPGLSLQSCMIQQVVERGIPLCSDIDLFFSDLEEPVIGITGTNGKSTVTSLVGHLLKSCYPSVGVGGNLGEAALQLRQQKFDRYVLELSSFQIERSSSLPLQAASVLNVTEDHLDKHGDMQVYGAIKRRIYDHAVIRVVNRQDPQTHTTLDGVVSFGLDAPKDDEWGLQQDAKATWICYGRNKLIDVEELAVSGKHNLLNVLAACALVYPQLSLAQISQALPSFSGLSHRYETVAEIDGATFVNDSKATNVGATIAALSGLQANSQVVLIAGGEGKGADFGQLSQVFSGRVVHLVTMGVDAAALEEVAKCVGVTFERVQTMQEAVDCAATAAAKLRAQDKLVLLSPACASLDMFENFKARGDAFKQAVANRGGVHG